jgi:hypothetical protein
MQSRGFGREIIRLSMSIIEKLGHRYLITDYFSNIRSQRVSQKHGVTVRVLPRAAYLTGTGWLDQVIVYSDLNNYVNLTSDQLTAENLQDRSAATDNKKLTAKL